MMNPLKYLGSLFSKQEEIEEPDGAVFWISINKDEAHCDIHIPDGTENIAEIVYYLIKNMASGGFVPEIIQLIMDKKDEFPEETRLEISKAMTYILADPMLVTDEEEFDIPEDAPIVQPSEVFKTDE